MSKLVVVCLVTVLAGACREDARQPPVALSILPPLQSAAGVSPPPAARIRQVPGQGASRGAQERDGSDDSAPDTARRPGESVESFVSRLVSEVQPCSRNAYLIQGTRFEACGARRSEYGYAMLYRPDAVVVDGADAVTVYVCHDEATHLACREGGIERDRTTHVAVRVDTPAGGRYWRHANVRWSGDPCDCAPGPPAAPAAQVYDSCTALRRDWNGGIRSDPDSWDPYPYPASWTAAERETYLRNVAEHGEGGGETDYEHPLDSNEDGTFCDAGDSAEPLSPGPPPGPADHDSCSALLAVWSDGVRHDVSDWDPYPYPDLDSWWTAEEATYARNDDLDDDGGPGAGDGHACGPGDTGVD